MTVELAQYLIDLDKYILKDGEKVDSFTIDIHYPVNLRLTLTAPDDLDQSLLIDIKESEKKSLKLTLHHQDNSTQNGLLRIDYNGRHRNPFEITDSVPERFKPFAGLWLDDFQGHIHYVVDGFKPLSWAIPLEVDDYPINELNGREGYGDAFNAFFKKINLRTKIRFNHQMRLL